MKDYIRVPCYESYADNGYNFRKSVQDPDSQLRKVYEYLMRNGSITRQQYYSHYNPNGLEWSEKKHKWVVRRGYGSMFWAAMTRSGFLKHIGRGVYVAGSEFRKYHTIIKFFNKTNHKYVYTWPEK